MSEPDENEKALTGSDGTLKEVFVVWTCVALLTALVELASRGVPILRQNLLAVIAGLFMLAPIVVLKRHGRSDRDYGLDLRELRKGVAIGSAVALVTLMGFVPVFHIYQTSILGNDAAFSLDRLGRPGEKLMGAPTDDTNGDMHLYDTGASLVVSWTPPGDVWDIDIETTGGARLAPLGAEPTEQLTFSGESGGTFRRAFRTLGAGTVDVRARSRADEGERWADADVTIGAGERAPVRDGDRSVVQVGFLWLLLALATQVLLVALPEEFFYRGYLQRRLTEATGSRELLKLGPMALTTEIVVISALFAVGHYVVGFDPSRLSVFFPSLVFGMLRDSTGGIVAPTVYHALCNMMVQIAVLMYVPA